jgi:hypothetical protein
MVSAARQAMPHQRQSFTSSSVRQVQLHHDGGHVVTVDPGEIPPVCCDVRQPQGNTTNGRCSASRPLYVWVSNCMRNLRYVHTGQQARQRMLYGVCLRCVEFDGMCYMPMDSSMHGMFHLPGKCMSQPLRNADVRRPARHVIHVTFAFGRRA